MKKFIVVVATALTVFNCGKNSKNKEKDEPGLLDAIEAVSDLKDIADEAEDIEEEQDKLLKTKPISKEKLKAFIPKEIKDYMRKSFTVGNHQLYGGVTYGEAEYKNENNSNIKLSVMDGAGETGSAVIAMHRLRFASDFERETEDGFEKTSKIDGHKAIVSSKKGYNDDTKDTNITILKDNRFLIALEGENINLDDLTRVFKSLDLDGLN